MADARNNRACLLFSLVVQAVPMLTIQGFSCEVPRWKPLYIRRPGNCDGNLYGTMGATNCRPDPLYADPRVDSMVQDMSTFFAKMVDPTTNRFYLYARPQSQERRLHAHCPLRDLGSTWDATKVLRLDKKKTKHYSGQLRDAVQTTVDSYGQSFCSLSQGVSLDPANLRETATLAHSALFILAAVGALESASLSRDEMDLPWQELVRGMLSRQRPDGSFASHFGTGETCTNDSDVAFVPGQAVTALLQVYEYSQTHCESRLVDEDTSTQILDAAVRALAFYRSYSQTHQVDANFPIWQVQAFARLEVVLENIHVHDDNKLLESHLISASDYVLDLCQSICASPAWRMVRRGPSFFANLSTLEVACGLDALAHGMRVARSKQAAVHAVVDLDTLERNAECGVDFLEWSLQRLDGASPFFGGLGYGGLQVMEQRLDVTGHALSALVTSVQHRQCT